MERGEDAEHDRDRRRQTRREQRHPPVDIDGIGREAPRPQRRQRRLAPEGDQHPADAAQHRQHRALGEEQTGHPRLAGAQRHPDRDLLPSPGRARQHQMGDVDAGDDEDQPHRPQHDEQDVALAPDQRVAQRHQPPGQVLVGVLDQEPLAQRRHRRLGLRGANARTQPPHRVEIVAVEDAGLILLGAQGMLGDEPARRHPQLRGCGEVEVRRQHALDGEQLAVQRDGPPHDVARAIEVGSPQRLRQDRGAGPIGHAAQHRRGRHHLEEARRHLGAGQPFRPVGALGVESAETVGGDVEDVLSLAPGDELASGQATVTLRLKQRDQAIGVGKGQRSQQHRVHHREHGGAEPDPERQGDDDDQRDRRGAPETAQRLPQIREKPTHEPVTVQAPCT